jgi:hypothetical protein
MKQAGRKRFGAFWVRGAGALFACLAAALACSPAGAERTGNSSGSGNTNGGSGSSGSSSQGGTGVVLQGGSSPGGGANFGGSIGGGAPDQCAATTTTAKLIPLDLYVLVDSSKSMNEPTTAGSTKWQALSDAMTGFFKDPNSAEIGVALKYFPDETAGVPAACKSDAECGATGPCDQRLACVKAGTFSKTIDTLCGAGLPACAADEICAPVQRCSDGANCAKTYCASSGPSAPCTADCVPFDGYCRNRDVCTTANYATPQVAFGVLPAAAQPLVDSITARKPDGFTPTGPALAGALQAAQERARANPDHKVSVVLVTDGLPGGFIPSKPPEMCMPGDIAGVASVLAAGAAGTPPIPTFVIGVFGPCDLVDANVMPQANLDNLAKAGGTTKSVVIRTDQNVTQLLQDALKQVRTSAIACQYAIPQSTELDFGKVNVNFSSAATGSKIIGYAGSKEQCDAVEGGWYYDVDPTKGVPKQIIACDQSCAKFQSMSDARVDIQLGCKTVVIR